MNGLIQRYRTLGELLAELKARLGFVAQGPASNNNNPVMISFLQEAHDYVYDQLNPIPMRKKTVITLEQGSFLYDWHNDARMRISIRGSLCRSGLSTGTHGRSWFRVFRKRIVRTTAGRFR